MMGRDKEGKKIRKRGERRKRRKRGEGKRER